MSEESAPSDQHTVIECDLRLFNGANDEGAVWYGIESTYGLMLIVLHPSDGTLPEGADKFTAEHLLELLVGATYGWAYNIELHLLTNTPGLPGYIPLNDEGEQSPFPFKLTFLNWDAPVFTLNGTLGPAPVLRALLGDKEVTEGCFANLTVDQLNDAFCTMVPTLRRLYIHHMIKPAIKQRYPDSHLLGVGMGETEDEARSNIEAEGPQEAAFIATQEILARWVPPAGTKLN